MQSVTAPKPTTAPRSRNVLADPDDPRYPRGRGVAMLRWVLRLGWLAFLIYPANALFNLLTLLANGNPVSWSSIARALLLDRLLILSAQRPLVVAVGVVGVLLVVVAGRVAHLDQEREREVLRLRGDLAHTRVAAEATAHTIARDEAHTTAEEVAHAEAHTTAAVIIGKIDEHLAEQKSAGDAAPEPQGPPFDEALLPLPEHFVGRSADLDWVLERLRTGGATSISALRGMGGIGKTTLAAVAVRQVRREGRFRDGVAVVPCIDLQDAGEVLRRALARFDPLRRQPKATDLAALTDVTHRLLDGKDALVVLDNIEPGLAIADDVAPLRETGIALLLTARQALPRTAVAADASRVLGLLSPEEALDLFARSFGRNGTAALTSAESAAAERIVAALDRHTLAIKLAGAYAADVHRDLGALARELEDPEQAMELPQDEAPQAVRRVFASSLEALPAEARRLFIALAAFATEEFGRQAAAAVGESLDLVQPAAGINLLVLRALVDASDDESMPEGSDRERLHLHPLLRAFAVTEFERLPEAERDAASQAVAQSYAGHAGHADERALGRDELNITGALEWAHLHDQDELVATLCASMQYFWRDRGRLPAIQHYIPWGMDAAERIATATEKRDDRLRAARLIVTYCRMLTQVARLDTGEALLTRALATLSALGDRLEEGEALAMVGDIAHRRGRLDDAERYLRESLSLHRQTYNRRGEGRALYLLGDVFRQRGQLDEGERYFEQAMFIARQTGDTLTETEILDSRGHALWRKGRLEEAEGLYRQALQLSRELQNENTEAVSLVGLGRLARLRGQLPEAEGYYRQALGPIRAIEDHLGEAYVLLESGELAQAGGRLDEAERYLEQSVLLFDETQDQGGAATAKRDLAAVEEHSGRRDDAAQHYRESLALALEATDGVEIANSSLALGRLLLELDRNNEEGCALLAEAARRFAEMRMPEEHEVREAIQRFGCEQRGVGG